MDKLESLLEHTAALHKHLCPRQVLGVRMGMYAAELLGLDLPQADKRLFTFVETDGCFADGVMAATGCALGRRTMRLMDYGKSSATFYDTKTECAVRISPHPDGRENAALYAPSAQSRWHTMLEAYQVMPTEALLIAQAVTLTVDMTALISRAGVRVNCAHCGEEIINEREVLINGEAYCKACADGAYYVACDG